MHRKLGRKIRIIWNSLHFCQKALDLFTHSQLHSARVLLNLPRPKFPSLVSFVLIAKYFFSGHVIDDERVVLIELDGKASKATIPSTQTQHNLTQLFALTLPLKGVSATKPTLN